MLLIAYALAASDVLGPLPEGTTLRGVEEHDEYERWQLRTDRDFVIELTRAVPGSDAVCSGGGVDLWVRLDEAKPGESFVWDPLPPVVKQACTRLESHAPLLHDRAVAEGEPLEPQLPETADGPLPERPPPDPPAWWPVSLLAAATSLGAVWVLAKGGRWPILAALGALLLRLAVSPRTVLLGGDAAFERLNALRKPMHSVLYGDGYPLLLGPLARLLDPHLANIVVSALAPAFGMIFLRRQGVAPQGAAMLAVLPLALALAGMEDAFVVVGTLQLLALAGPPAVTVLAAGLLAYTRPEQAVFLLLPLGLLVHQRRWAHVVALLAVCGPRWVELADPARLAHAAALVQTDRLARPDFLRMLLSVGSHAVWIALDPERVPSALLPFAVFAGWRHRRLGALVGVAILLGLLPTLPKTTPAADALRFQLASIQWLALLAGVGIAQVPRLGIPLTLLACWFARDPLHGPWAWQAEYDWLRVHLPGVTDQDLWINTSQDPNHAFRSWLEATFPVHVNDRARVHPPAGSLIYVGTADAIAHAPLRDLVPVDVAPIPAATDGWVDLGSDPLTIGLYRAPSPSGPP